MSHLTVDGSKDDIKRIIEASSAGQYIVEIFYNGFDDKFVGLGIDAKVSMISRSGAIDMAPQLFRYIRRLPHPSTIAADNASRWADNNSKLTQGALDVGLTKINEMISYVMSLTPEQFRTINGAPTHTGLIYNMSDASKSRSVANIPPAVLIDTKPIGSILHFPLSWFGPAWVYFDGEEFPHELPPPHCGRTDLLKNRYYTTGSVNSSEERWRMCGKVEGCFWE